MTSHELKVSGESLTTDKDPRPFSRYLLALGLYGLWVGLATLSNFLNQTRVDGSMAVVLLGGVAMTNVLFLCIARADRFYQPAQSATTAAQCIFGIVWATTYAFFSEGARELIFGMYVTTILFAVFQVSTKTFAALTATAVATYGAVVLGKGLVMPDAPSFWHDMLSLLAFLGVMWWVLAFGRHIHALREDLQERNGELQGMIQKVSRVAERDHLTKSFNRHYIMDSLAREKGRTDRSNVAFSICIFDLDHFKAMNDEHGHLVGDRILKAFAKRVRAELRTMDAVNRSQNRRSFGRFGGEEFIAILPATGLAGAERCAERIRKAIEVRPFGEVYRVTVSAGVAEYHRGESIPEVLARADQALYQAKSKGRNRVCVSRSKRGRGPGGGPARVMDLRTARR